MTGYENVMARLKMARTRMEGKIQAFDAVMNELQKRKREDVALELMEIRWCYKSQLDSVIDSMRIIDIVRDQEECDDEG